MDNLSLLRIEPVGVFICLILSVIFSASETVLTSLGHLKTKHLVESGKKRAKLLELWLSEPNMVLATILVGNTVANILASFLAAAYTFELCQSRFLAVAQR